MVILLDGCITVTGLWGNSVLCDGLDTLQHMANISVVLKNVLNFLCFSAWDMLNLAILRLAKSECSIQWFESSVIHGL